MNRSSSRVLRMVVAVVSLVMVAGLAGPASAGNVDPKESCKKGGWQELVRADGTPFLDQGECVSYVAAEAGVPFQPVSAIGVSFTEVFPGSFHCRLHVELIDGAPNTGYIISVSYSLTGSDPGQVLYTSPLVSTNDSGDATFSVPNFDWAGYINVSAGGATSGWTFVDC